MRIPYARDHNPFLIRNRSWILTIHKDKVVWKNLPENKKMVLKKWVKNIQTAGYDGVSTVSTFAILLDYFSHNIDSGFFVIAELWKIANNHKREKMFCLNKKKSFFFVSFFLWLPFYRKEGNILKGNRDNHNEILISHPH